MKKIIIISCVSAFLLLIVVVKIISQISAPAITIGKVAIYKDEFESALTAVSFLPVDNEFRKDFLEKFIARKLILYDAERSGLDKDPEFLREVQQLWEQALLNMALTRKIKEFSIDTQVTEQEIKTYYEQNKNIEFGGKSLEQAYDQVKWLLLNEKQRSAIEQWAGSLKQSVAINIDYKALGIEGK